jgi:hypothetical protein
MKGFESKSRVQEEGNKGSIRDKFDRREKCEVE